MHDIEHQVTYPGSNFIFHDSRGFESGSTDELEIAWKFIEKKCAETELKNQLHAIWYLALSIYSHYWLNWHPVGTVYPWTVLVLFYLQNLNSSIKGQAEVSPNVFIPHLVGFREIVSFNYIFLPPLANLPQSLLVLTSKYFLYSSSGGYIH